MRIEEHDLFRQMCETNGCDLHATIRLLGHAFCPVCYARYMREEFGLPLSQKELDSQPQMSLDLK